MMSTLEHPDAGTIAPSWGSTTAVNWIRLSAAWKNVFSDAGLSIPPARFAARGFLRLLAFVETKDGSNWNFCVDGGIWNVDYQSLDQCSQSFNIGLIIHSATSVFGL